MKHFAEAGVQFNRVLKDAPGDEITHLYLGEISFGKKDSGHSGQDTMKKAASRICARGLPGRCTMPSALLAQKDASASHRRFETAPGE